jgi:hypothetical protein
VDQAALASRDLARKVGLIMLPVKCKQPRSLQTLSEAKRLLAECHSVQVMRYFPECVSVREASDTLPPLSSSQREACAPNLLRKTLIRCKDMADLDSLVESIRELGLLQPLLGSASSHRSDIDG